MKTMEECSVATTRRWRRSGKKQPLAFVVKGWQKEEHQQQQEEGREEEEEQLGCFLARFAPVVCVVVLHTWQIGRAHV